jgi:hypothetical protein
MNYLLRKSFALGVISLWLASLAAPVLAADGTPRRKKCPFEKRTVSQVVSATRPTPEFQIAQAQPVALVEPAAVAAVPPPAVAPTEPAIAQPMPPANVAQTDAPPATTPEEPAATDAVARVRAVYKTICSRSRQVQLPPREQPPAQPPAAAPIEAPAPVRALW